jgi:hypothetical protein
VDVPAARLLGLAAVRHEWPAKGKASAGELWEVSDSRGVLGTYVPLTGSCRVLNVIHAGVTGAAALVLFAAAVRVKGVGRG